MMRLEEEKPSEKPQTKEKLQHITTKSRFARFFTSSWHHVTVIILADVMLSGLGERKERWKKKPVHNPSMPVVAES